MTARPTAVVAESTSWEAYPALWPRLLDEVWSAVRPRREQLTPGRNVMLYLDAVPHVEVGVEVASAFEALGRVVPSLLPAGRVATTTLEGRYEEIGSAHEAVVDWCDCRGLERTGVRWEIYGHWREDSVDQEVEVYWLLR